MDQSEHLLLPDFEASEVMGGVEEVCNHAKNAETEAETVDGVVSEYLCNIACRESAQGGSYIPGGKVR